MSRYEGLREFCERSTVTDLDSEGQPIDAYIRIRQKDGRTKPTVASNIEPGDDAGALEKKLAGMLGGLDAGAAWVERMHRGDSSPVDTVKVTVAGSAGDGEDDDPATVGAGVAAVLAEARRMMASADERAARAQERAWDALEQAHRSREEAIVALAQQHGDQAQLAAATEVFGRAIDALGPVVKAKLLSDKLGTGPKAKGAGAECEAAPSSDGGEAGEADWKRAAMAGAQVLVDAVEAEPALLEDPDLVGLLRPLVMRAVGA